MFLPNFMPIGISGFEKSAYARQINRPRALTKSEEKTEGANSSRGNCYLQQWQSVVLKQVNADFDVKDLGENVRKIGRTPSRGGIRTALKEQFKLKELREVSIVFLRKGYGSTQMTTMRLPDA